MSLILFALILHNRMVPPEEKDRLLKLLPSIDSTSLQAVQSLFQSNPFFRSCVASLFTCCVRLRAVFGAVGLRELQTGLSHGAFDPTLDYMSFRRAQRKRKVNLDWKAKHFENYYGEASVAAFVTARLLTCCAEARGGGASRSGRCAIVVCAAREHGAAAAGIRHQRGGHHARCVARGARRVFVLT